MTGNFDSSEAVMQIAASNDEIRAVFDYWRRKAGDRRMPSRADIDPVELKPFLPRITLVDVVDDQRHLVYRLAGTREVEARGADPTGKPVGDAYFGPSQNEVVRRYNYVIEYQAPYYFRGGFEFGDRFVENEEIIFLPLSDDSERVNMILVFVHAEDYALPAA
jgi:hypothetical protein